MVPYGIARWSCLDLGDILDFVLPRCPVRCHWYSTSVVPADWRQEFHKLIDTPGWNPSWLDGTAIEIVDHLHKSVVGPQMSDYSTELCRNHVHAKVVEFSPDHIVCFVLRSDEGENEVTSGALLFATMTRTFAAFALNWDGLRLRPLTRQTVLLALLREAQN